MTTRNQAEAELKAIVHPVADLFPLMDDEQLNELAESIKRHDQKEPVVFYGDKLIDGRNRWLACRMLGIKPRVCEMTVSEDFDLLSFVLTQNLHRRHLTEAQRAMVGARMKKMFAPAAKERQREHGKTAPGKAKTVDANLHQVNGRAHEQAAKSVNVSPRSVANAATVIERGSKDLVALVDAGKCSVSKAAKIAKDVDKKDQAAAATKKTPRKKNTKPKPDPPTELDEDAEVVTSIMFDDSFVDSFDSVPKHERVEAVKKIIGKLTEEEREQIVGWIGGSA